MRSWGVCSMYELLQESWAINSSPSIRTPPPASLTYTCTVCLYSALPHSLSIHLYFRLTVFRMSFRLYTTMLSVPLTVVTSWFCVCQCYTVCLCVCFQSVFLYAIFICLSVFFSVRLVCLSVCLFFLFVCMFIFCLSVCQFITLSVCIFLYLSVGLSGWLSVSLSLCLPPCIIALLPACLFLSFLSINFSYMDIP
jgi:hypothetical protein